MAALTAAEDEALYGYSSPGAMQSDTGLGSILGAATTVGTSWFGATNALATAKLTNKQQLAMAAQQTAAQKTVLMLAVVGAVIVAIIVVISMLRRK